MGFKGENCFKISSLILKWVASKGRFAMINSIISHFAQMCNTQYTAVFCFAQRSAAEQQMRSACSADEDGEKEKRED